MKNPIDTLALSTGQTLDRAGTSPVRWPLAQAAHARSLAWFVLAAGVAIVCVASLSYAVSETAEFTRFANVALVAASADPRVVDALGSPVTLSGSPGGRWTEREGQLFAAVQGSKAAGRLTATGTRTSDGWTLRSLVVKSGDGRRTIVVTEGSGPSGGAR